MRNIIFQALAEAARGGEAVALGVITAVHGSSPQKVGAKAVFYADGRIQGTLGGGCLEAEIQQRAIQSLRTGQGSSFDLVLDHDFGWDDGLMCGGRVCGLILPNAQQAGAEFWSELAERQRRMTWGVKGDYSIAGAVEIAGGTQGPARAADVPRQPGQPPHPGPLPLGGGEGETSAVPEKADVPSSTKALPKSPPLPFGRGEGRREGSVPSAGYVVPRREREAVEAGEDWLYQETVTVPCALWIAGAGHIAQAVAPLALQLDFSVTVFDDRPALASHQFFPREVSLQAEVWEKLLAVPSPAAPSFGLIVTRGHRHDALVLKEWVHRPFLFLGMIGSARKARIIFEQFVEEKLATPGELQRVASPVGVKIRSQSPLEIAVSIVAQFIDKRAELVYGRMD